MELQSRLPDLEAAGLGLVAISYDSPAVLKRFAAGRAITFPLLSDIGSKVIKRYGLLNESYPPGDRAHGVPYPGTFVLDRNGRVTSRHFEAAYQERSTVASILTRRGRTDEEAAIEVSGRFLEGTASVSDTTVAPGSRITIAVEITPMPGMHIYAPGAEGYTPIELRIDGSPLLIARSASYPASEEYYFAPLKERVPVFQKAFRITRDVTISASREAQQKLRAMTSLPLSAHLNFQACSATVCFPPQSVPLSWTLKVTPLVPAR